MLTFYQSGRKDGLSNGTVGATTPAPPLAPIPADALKSVPTE
ncbi:MAG TPA: hypothetical protein PJ988_02860 [Anaerolinea sp.]|nr:hypothetical protein [Anaerolinea sp.]